MFKHLFVLLPLVAATLFVTSPAHAEAPAGATRSCAKTSESTSTSFGRSGVAAPATVARSTTSEDAPAASALGEIHRYWYSDATYTTVVGYEYLNECDGSYQFWGVRTSYLSQFRTHCWA